MTGTHSLKAGYQGAYEVTDIFGNFATHGLQYRFNVGVPDLITQRITPWQQANRTRYDAFYAQDQWTRDRLTLQGALRYERAWSFFPEGINGLLADSVFGGPTRPAARRRRHRLRTRPRMGPPMTCGNGKTAIAESVRLWQSHKTASIRQQSGVDLAQTRRTARGPTTATKSWSATSRTPRRQCVTGGDRARS